MTYCFRKFSNINIYKQKTDTVYLDNNRYRDKFIAASVTWYEYKK